jgi:RNA polymerase sigma-70 factor (ECF subfamily)
MPKNNDSWLERLYNEQYINVYRLVRFLLQQYPVEDTHDIVQQVFMLASEKNISRHEKPAAWLFVTARNLCKNYRRTIRRQTEKEAILRKQHLSTQPSGAMDSSVQDETDAVDTMLTLRSVLSASDFELIAEYCIKGTDIKEISAKTGMSENCIRVRIHRIREQLKGILLILLIALFKRQTFL